ncbi:MFS general substrate transporter [Polychaeton citri CBS 116435]|uniref:MFS general substrate transporter n=1 Tax=Polychaeton citri CBS 116435 TaxID=1314669 RepID=A0A9P4QC95_9PEZI|nr:MFS general substrate transporter [Polychaeton citri CBS 116435]
MSSPDGAVARQQFQHDQHHAPTPQGAKPDADQADPQAISTATSSKAASLSSKSHEGSVDDKHPEREHQDTIAPSPLAQSLSPPTPSSPEQSPTFWQRKPWSVLYRIATYVPPRCRYDPNAPPKFSMALNVLFGFAGAFTVANLYYTHPILNILAQDFDVPYVRVSQIPTVAQAGYASGLLFLCPLGDMFKRRPFVLSLVWLTATLTLALCLTSSLEVFSGMTFIIGVATVTPQLMLPLVGDLAPPNRRAAAMSIVVSGLMLGILVARLLSGILTQYTSWRVVYWLSFGLQYIIVILLYLFMPDYPATNKGLNYFKVLWSILVMLTKHPVLVQACLISFFTAATFTNYWTTVTFLLAGPPYHYGPVIIGLFALIGIGIMCFGPPYARHVIDRFVPHLSVLLGLTYSMIGTCLGTYIGTFSIAGPILQAFLVDFGLQTSQISNRSAIFSIEPKARNRVNTAFMVATFCGQLVGTTVGSHLYAIGGWEVSGSYSVASLGVAFLVTFARGPWEDRWIGWRGGWSMKKKCSDSVDGRMPEPGAAAAATAAGHAKPEELDLEKGVNHSEAKIGDAEAANEGRETERAMGMLAAENEPVGRKSASVEHTSEKKVAESHEDVIAPAEGKRG